MTAPRRKPAQRPAGPYIPHQLSEEDLLELNEPCDYPTYPGRWIPEYPGPDELLEIGRARDPERDLEAEP